MFPGGLKLCLGPIPRISSTARTVWTKSFWTVGGILNWGNVSGKRGPTLSTAGGEARVRKGFVRSLDGEDGSEVRVDVREDSNDYGPDQSTVIVLLRLRGIVQPCDRSCGRFLT